MYVIRFQEKNLYLNRDSNLQISRACEWHVFQEDYLSMHWQLNQNSSMTEGQAKDL